MIREAAPKQEEETKWDFPARNSRHSEIIQSGLTLLLIKLQTVGIASMGCGQSYIPKIAGGYARNTRVQSHTPTKTAKKGALSVDVAVIWCLASLQRMLYPYESRSRT
jgi:hypothetical protein